MATLETEDLATDVDLVITDQGNPAKALPYLEDYLHTIKQDLEAINTEVATIAAGTDVAGSRGGNAALANLLTALATAGIITDSTT